MPKIDSEIPEPLYSDLNKYLQQNPLQELDQVVSQALRLYLKTRSDTVFQISTAGALVNGVYSGALTVEALLQHGNLGLGTFESLDGEMIIVDGEVFQARCDQSVEPVPPDHKTPFAVITHFAPAGHFSNIDCRNLDELEKEFDRFRDSDNICYALRITGVFEKVHLRAVCLTESGVPLVQAAAVQAEYHLENISGTLVGFWSPDYARALNVPGYHLHFLSQDKTKGGHLLDLAGANLRLELERKTTLMTMLPQNQQFLQADLRRDPAADLERAERAGKKETNR
jgi:acetolactate decarboxylase